LSYGKLVPDYTVQEPRRQPSSYSRPWEPEILPNIFSTEWLSLHVRYVYEDKIMEDFLQFEPSTNVVGWGLAESL
jgi:hypothetical protein